MRTRTLLATLAILMLTTVPATQAHETEPAPNKPLVYYLNADGEHLNLTALPPSAANASTWDLAIDDGRYWDAAHALRLAPPVPLFTLNESAGFSGSLTVDYRREASLLAQCASLRLDVDLVEGARRVSALSTQVATYERVYPFGGDFPGHGERAAPHTHGDGSDVNRGLRTDDVAFEVRFSLVDSLYSQYSLGSCVHRIAVGIDGTSFAELWPDSPVAAPTRTPTVPSNESQAKNATTPANDNETTGNASSNASTSANQSPDPRLYLASEDEAVNTPTTGLLPGIAAVAAGAAVARRRRLT